MQEEPCNCGKLLRKEETNMKKSKWLWMLLVVLLALCLTACDDEDDDDESDKKSPTEAVQDVTPTETVATPTDAADVTPTGEITIAPTEAPAKEFIWTIDESLVAADYLPAFTSEELTDCQGLRAESGRDRRDEK